jgi:Fur family peroxide stress response transcriptional regulator
MKSSAEKLKSVQLRVTPQRIAVLDALYGFTSHPSAEEISRTVRTSHPNIATGTIYHILETFTRAGLCRLVKTNRGAMLYDVVHDKHHHLYCEESERIEDYYDETLDALLEEYFRKKHINDFDIQDIRLQIVGKFRHKKP